MNDKLALLQNIITDPKCDTSRLVYADYIQEHGEEERAEFIRVQVELAKSHTHFDPPSGFTGFVSSKDRNPRYDELRRRERELFYDTEIFNDVIKCNRLLNGIRITEDAIRECELPTKGLITRGFISHITCTAEDFLKYADRLVWNEKMTSECLAKDCRRGIDTKEMGRCQVCKGRGVVPRPVPVTAQPVEKVTLTTEPVSTSVMSDVVLARFADRDSVECQWYRPCRERTVFLLNYYWPGIEFELPPVTSDTFTPSPDRYEYELWGPSE